MVVVILVFVIFMLLACLIPNKWLDQAQETAHETAREAVNGMQLILGSENDHVGLQTTEIPLDIVTSQMIAWLITNCEDSRSVDTALQAIAGANVDLPCEPLVQCGARELVIQRLRVCIQLDPNTNKVSVKELPTLPQALAYCGTYSFLVSGEKYKSNRDTWNQDADDFQKNIGRGYEDLHMMRVVTELLNQAMHESKNSRGLTANLLAATAAAAMPFCHWDWSPSPDSTHRYIAPNVAATVLDQHLKSKDAVLSAATLYMLVESTVHYLIVLWPKHEDQGFHNILPLQLAQVYSATRDAAPDTARAVAVTLAVTAFAVGTYPGGEEPSNGSDAREQRARKSLEYYRVNKPTNDVVSSLFVFGFAALLPQLRFGNSDTMPITQLNPFDKIKRSMALYNIKGGQTNIHTLPPTFLLLDHATRSALQCISSVEGPDFSVDDEPTVAFASSSFLLPNREGLHAKYPELYGATAIALCRAKSKQLQEICVKIIDSQSLPEDPLKTFNSVNGKDFLQRLCRVLPHTRAPVIPVAILQFRLLVASIMLSTEHPLGERQSSLKPLLSSHPEFAKPWSSTVISSPVSADQLFLHLNEESISQEPALDSMHRTLRFIFDFCHADTDLELSLKTESVEALTASDWHARLEGVKDAHKQDTGTDELTSLQDLGQSSLAIQYGVKSEKTVNLKPSSASARLAEPATARDGQKAKRSRT
ncbi:hypothetical protein FRC09_007597 [Ceratobasidium sp. 395]|nr:hypothetical protein FRC09_007597 [Ceratobasidium sp. 395]